MAVVHLAVVEDVRERVPLRDGLQDDVGRVVGVAHLVEVVLGARGDVAAVHRSCGAAGCSGRTSRSAGPCWSSGSARENTLPLRTSCAAALIRSGVTLLSVPSWSSGPHLPQVLYFAASARTVSIVGAVVVTGDPPQNITTPALTLRSSPVMDAAASDERNVQAAAISRASTSRPSGDDSVNARERLRLGDAAGCGLAARDVVDPGAGDRAGAHRVDADPVRAQLQRQRAHEPDHAHLRRRVGRAAVQRPLAGHRRDRDQAPSPAARARDERAEGQEHAVEVGGQALPPRREGHVVHRGGRARRCPRWRRRCAPEPNRPARPRPARDRAPRRRRRRRAGRRWARRLDLADGASTWPGPARWRRREAAAASPTAMARPMPRLAPVTTATRSLIGRS